MTTRSDSGTEILAGAADTALRDAMARLTTAGVDNPRFEAQLLLALALGVSRTAVLTGLHPEPNADQQKGFARLLAARVRRVPLAYLRGTQEFYGLNFAVTPAVLIPRPETELLVDFAREKLADRTAENNHDQDNDPPCFADVGAGSGCVAIAILAHCPQARGIAFDLAPDALAIARKNAVANGVAARLGFARGDLLTGANSGRFDVIVSNPPYISQDDLETLQPEVREFEPRLALDGGLDGLALYRPLASQARRALKPGGWLAVEVGQGQAAPVRALLEQQGLSELEIRPDLAGIGRVVCGRKPDQPLQNVADERRPDRVSADGEGGPAWT